jgi:ring-1,2-phenylacetyl-CoA epoxidase subunit PaaC
MTPEHKKALITLLYYLADDNFILAYRGSEWLGLAPHIEEDVAFSSINQDMMGHAVMYYSLLEALGEGHVDELAHRREAKAFKNATVLELKNGKGDYLHEPEFDWAFTVVRSLFFATYKKERLQALRQSTYQPLAQAAAKILTEHTYHLMHWEIWFVQLMSSTAEARVRMEGALRKVWDGFGDVLSYGKQKESIAAYGLLIPEEQLTERWLKRIKPLFDKVTYTPDGNPGFSSGHGRKGEHTEDLDQALATLSEVYLSDPLATGW